jgi:hypothetical protein
VKKAGDLEVRLEDFVAGNPVPGSQKTLANGHQIAALKLPKRGMGGETFPKAPSETDFVVTFHSPNLPNYEWHYVNAELSDATGNVLRSDWDSDMVGFFDTLFPDETAWRLKLEVKRISGFSPEELVTFTNVPVPIVGATITNRMTKTFAGVKFALQEFNRKPNPTNAREPVPTIEQSWIHFEIHAPPHGVEVEVAQVRTDRGWNIEALSAKAGETLPIGFKGVPESAYSVFLKSIPANAKAVDITWVVQRTRSVEFMVKPPKAE